MAYLDNSGDIILDALLTDLGRKRLADGNFRIDKFALGDDEINYGQYKVDHPSGSAYADLEILQTPIFEAASSQNAAINYGLLSLTRNNILYLPTIKPNYTISDVHSVKTYNGILHLAVNDETLGKIKTDTGGAGHALMQNQTGDLVLYWESGIDTTDEPANPTARYNLITATGMLDTQFTVDVDVRFINMVYQLSGDQNFTAPADSTATPVIPSKIVPCNAGGRTRNLKNYISFQVRGVHNMMFTPTSGTRTDPSVLAGPRGTGAATNFAVASELQNKSTGGTPDKFVKFGKTAQLPFGGSNTYDFIDTTVYIRGNSSTATLQVPLRIIRYAGS